MQTVTIDRTKVWTADDYLLLGEIKTPCQLINGELTISPALHLYLASEGLVTSTVLEQLNFDLKEIF